MKMDANAIHLAYYMMLAGGPIFMLGFTIMLAVIASK